MPGDDAEKMPNGGEPCGRKKAPTKPGRSGTDDDETALDVAWAVGVADGAVGDADGCAVGDGVAEPAGFELGAGVGDALTLAFATASSERSWSAAGSAFELVAAAAVLVDDEPSRGNDVPEQPASAALSVNANRN